MTLMQSNQYRAILLPAASGAPHPRMRQAIGQHAGFTALEALTVSSLMSLLVLMISATWVGLGRPIAEVIARCRVTQEASRAASCLAEDVAGALPTAVPTGQRKLNRVVGRLVPSSSEFWLCFDGGASPNGLADWAAPDTVIIYRRESGTLRRVNQTAGDYWTVARHLDAISVRSLGADTEITLTFRHRDVTRSYVLVAK